MNSNNQNADTTALHDKITQAIILLTYKGFLLEHACSRPYIL